MVNTWGLLTASGPSHHAVCKVAQGGHRYNRVLFAGAQLVEDKQSSLS